MEALSASRAGFARRLDTQPRLRLLDAPMVAVDYEEELGLVQRYIAHVLDLLGETGTIRGNRRRALAGSLQQAFQIELAPGRRLVLPDLLLPGQGKRTIDLLDTTLAKLDEAISYRLLSDLRVFLRAIADQGAHVLYAEGVDLKARYGPLVCPIGRLRRPPSPTSILPPLDKRSMERLYAAMFAWPSLRGRGGELRLVDWRSVLDLLLAFEGGLRAAEIVLLVLGDQWLENVNGLPHLSNPLKVSGVKGGGLRDAYLEADGLKMLNRFIAEVRPLLAADPWRGIVLPSTDQSERPRNPATLRAVVGDGLIRYLQDEGLLDPSFTACWQRALPIERMSRVPPAMPFRPR